MTEETGSIDKQIYNELKTIIKAKFPIFLESYIQSMDTYTDAVKDALTNHDLDQILENVHPMQSSSLALGATVLGETADSIQVMVYQHKKTGDVILREELDLLCNKLISQYDSVRHYIKKEL